jgi:hypothetical protein
VFRAGAGADGSVLSACELPPQPASTSAVITTVRDLIHCADIPRHTSLDAGSECHSL